uniref:NADH dehydrogenase [ubiquinone] iron-sulfur protein 4, mitochondrial n=2 Tax=Hemiselmis andersenii TaxID=464988 RepID=A0A6U4M9D9_HEMAN|mmetsp:Transcript_18605/g.42991  ORF Transcript_18605/g.42991 Transcript_18605/m.42991 type:complete len:171 (+) Transcript_18605:30-542(+)
MLGRATKGLLSSAVRARPAVAATAARSMATKSTSASVYAVSGLSEDIYEGRKVTIYRPARSAMSQGVLGNKRWKLMFDMQGKWSNPLMGWTSGKDTLGTQLAETLTFPDPESAIAFCKKHQLQYEVEEPEESEVIATNPKKYADNFQWDGDEEDFNTGVSHWATRRSGTK